MLENSAENIQSDSGDVDLRSSDTGIDRREFLRDTLSITLAVVFADTLLADSSDFPIPGLVPDIKDPDYKQKWNTWTELKKEMTVQAIKSDLANASPEQQIATYRAIVAINQNIIDSKLDEAGRASLFRQNVCGEYYNVDPSTFGKICDGVSYLNNLPNLARERRDLGQEESDGFAVASGVLGGASLVKSGPFGAISGGASLALGLVSANLSSNTLKEADIMDQHGSPGAQLDYAVDVMLELAPFIVDLQGQQTLDPKTASRVKEVLDDPVVKEKIVLKSNYTDQELYEKQPQAVKDVLIAYSKNSDGNKDPKTNRTKFSKAALDSLRNHLSAKPSDGKGDQTLPSDQPNGKAEKDPEAESEKLTELDEKVDKLLSEQKRRAEIEKKRREERKFQQEISAAIDIGGIILGDFLGKKEEARVFTTVARTAQTLYQVSKAFQAGEIGATALTGNYLAAGMAIVNLISGAKSPEQMMLEAINQLRQDVAELRNDLQKFRVETLKELHFIQKQNIQILTVLVEVLDEVTQTGVYTRAKLDRIETQLNYMINRGDLIKRQERAGDFYEVVGQAKTLIATPPDYQRSHDARSNHDDYKSAFERHACVDSREFLLSGSAIAELEGDSRKLKLRIGEEIRRRRLPELLLGLLPKAVELLPDHSVSADFELANPFEWAQGTNAYLELRTSMPHFKNSVYAEDLSNMWQVGVELKRGIRELTRPEVIDAALKEYSDSVAQVVAEVEKAVVDFARQKKILSKKLGLSELPTNNGLTARTGYAFTADGLVVFSRGVAEISPFIEILQHCIDLGIVEMKVSGEDKRWSYSLSSKGEPTISGVAGPMRNPMYFPGYQLMGGSCSWDVQFTKGPWAESKKSLPGYSISQATYSKKGFQVSNHDMATVKRINEDPNFRPKRIGYGFIGDNRKGIPVGEYLHGVNCDNTRIEIKQGWSGSTIATLLPDANGDSVRVSVSDTADFIRTLQLGLEVYQESIASQLPKRIKDVLEVSPEAAMFHSSGALLSLFSKVVAWSADRETDFSDKTSSQGAKSLYQKPSSNEIMEPVPGKDDVYRATLKILERAFLEPISLETANEACSEEIQYVQSLLEKKQSEDDKEVLQAVHNDYQKLQIVLKKYTDKQHTNWLDFKEELDNALSRIQDTKNVYGVRVDSKVDSDAHKVLARLEYFTRAMKRCSLDPEGDSKQTIQSAILENIKRPLDAFSASFERTLKRVPQGINLKVVDSTLRKLEAYMKIHGITPPGGKFEMIGNG
jgi:hypothetical protein